MHPSQAPLLPAVAATPIILACASCDTTTVLGPDREVQRSEVAAFLTAHNGHGGPMRYMATIPTTRNRPEGHLGSASSQLALGRPLAGALSMMRTPASQLSGRFWQGIVDLVFGRRDWYFT